MQVRQMFFGAALASAMAICSSAQAGPVIGSLSFSDIGATTTNTGNINTATVFNFGNLISVVTTSVAVNGDFFGLPNQFFGPVSFDITDPTSLTFSSTAFGSFSSTAIMPLSSAAGAVSFYILGNYTPGTFIPGGDGGLASFTVAFTQTPAFSGSISGSATLASPPAPFGTPEPTTYVAALMGAGALVGMIRRARKTA